MVNILSDKQERFGLYSQPMAEKPEIARAYAACTWYYPKSANSVESELK